jgi:hypothetical protein
VKALPLPTSDDRREVMAYPFYRLSITPGLRRLFDFAYRTFSQNRYCVSRALKTDRGKAL